MPVRFELHDHDIDGGKSIPHLRTADLIHGHRAQGKNFEDKKKTLRKQIKILTRKREKAFKDDDMDELDRLGTVMNDKSEEHAKLPDIDDGYEKYIMKKKGKEPEASELGHKYKKMDKGGLPVDKKRSIFMSYDDEKKYHDELDDEIKRTKGRPVPKAYKTITEFNDDGSIKKVKYEEQDPYEKNREKEKFKDDPYNKTGEGKDIEHHKVSMRKKRELIHGSKEEGDASLFKDYDDNYDKDDRDRRLKNFHGFTDDEIKTHDKLKTDPTKIFEKDEKKYVKKDSDGRAYIAHKGTEENETTKEGRHTFKGEKKREGRFFTSDVKHGEGSDHARNDKEFLTQKGEFKNDHFSEGERHHHVFDSRKTNQSIGKFDENGNLKEGSHTVIDNEEDSKRTFTGRFDRNGNPTGDGTLTTKKTTTFSDDSTRTSITQSDVNAEEDTESNAETDIIHNAEKKNPKGLENDAEMPNSIKNGKKNSQNLEKGVGSLKHSRNNKSEYRETRDKHGKVVDRNFDKRGKDGSTGKMTEKPEENHENGRMKTGTRQVVNEKDGNAKITTLEGNFDENGNFTDGTVTHKDSAGNVISKPMSFSEFEQQQGTLPLPTSDEGTMSEMENNLSNAEKIGSDVASESKEFEEAGDLMEDL